MSIPGQGLVNLTDAELDQPVYRIYGLKRFFDLLSSKQDGLIKPSKWEDPFENFMLSRTQVIDSAGTRISLDNLAADWYGQCWSLTEESDAMWRIYSPDVGVSPGVKVKTTIRRLFDNLKMVGPPDWGIQFFVGKVRYVTEAQLTAHVSTLTFERLAFGGDGRGMAELLCVKRDTFQHENEVRLLFCDMEIPAHNRPRLGGHPAFNYGLDPAAIFDEVLLDPRLKPLDAAKMEADLLGAGCSIPIRQSPLYQIPSFVIPLS